VTQVRPTRLCLQHTWFGIGYSSLADLTLPPVAAIKIDWGWER
jgi:predicted signal transduction protein with EAL and GGDEF domain